MKEAKQKGRPVTTPGGDNMLARYRRENNLSQREAAGLLGISQNRVSELERAARLPTGVAMLVSLVMAMQRRLGEEGARAVFELAAQIRKEENE